MGKISPFAIFGETFSQSTRWMHLFLPIAFIMQLVMLAVNLEFMGTVTGQMAPEKMDQFMENFWTLWAVMMLVAFSVHSVQMSLFDAVIEERGDWLPFGISRALKRLLPVIVGAGIFVIAYAIGILLLVIPGLMVLFLLYMMTPLILLDGVNPFAAAKASWRLTWGNAWRLFGAVLLVFVPVMLFFLIAGMVLGTWPGSIEDGTIPQFGWSDWQTWAQAFVMALVAVIFTCFYLAAFKALKAARAEREGEATDA